MPLQGAAAVAMWWNIAPAHREEFEDWHSHEHLPERLSIPGFRRGSRWAAEAGEGFFVLYELADYEVLTSPAYRARLDDPTPWSVQMMPRHRDMVRSQCRLAASQGLGLGGCMGTLRLSPAPGREAALLDGLSAALAKLAGQPGLAGAHLLRTETPGAAPTTEQRIRGGADAVADWILLLSGYEAAAVTQALEIRLGPDALAAAGAAPGQQRGLYRLRHALTGAELG